MSGRSLAQQLEYWARLGAALDAAGVTTEQAMRMLGGDLDFKASVVHILGSAQAQGKAPVAELIAQRHRQDEADVLAGARSAQSLAVIPQDWVARAQFMFPADTKPERGW